MAKILEIRIDNISIQQAVKKVVKWLEDSGPKIFTVVTPNPEIIVQAQDDPKLRKILNGADLAVPDGAGLRLAGVENIAPGVELMKKLCESAAKRGWVVGLYGGRDRTAKEALRILRKKHSGLKGWAKTPPELTISIADKHMRPSDRKEIDWIVDKVRKTKTRLLFVGLGAPKQEYFIEKMKNEKGKMKDGVILMAVGGALDEIAGRVLPAPLLFRKFGLKWLWRLMQEPWRIRRQMRLVKYVVLVLMK